MSPTNINGSKYYIDAIKLLREGETKIGMEFLYLSANRGCLIAMKTLAMIFHNGSYGIERDIDNAEFWFSQAKTSCLEFEKVSEDPDKKFGK